MRFLAAFLLCGLGCCAEPAARSAFDKATFVDYVRHLLLFTPGVQVSVDDPKPVDIGCLKEVDLHVTFGPNSETLKFYVSNDGKHLINVTEGGAYNIDEDPFQADRDLLNTAGAPAFGSAGAPLTMVIFSDFECPQCRLEAEMLRKDLLATYPTQVRLFFKDFPLESLHPWAKAAAVTGRCVFQQGEDHFWAYHDWIYSHQPDIRPDSFRARIEEFAKGEKLDEVQLGHCMDSPQGPGAEVDKEIAEGKALGINATPTMFLNGRRLVGSKSWENLNAIIEAELDYAKSHPAPATASKTADKQTQTQLK